MSNVRFIGLDVHAETIAVAVAEPDGEVRSLGVIPNRPESIRKLMKKLGPAESLRVCYEAGPTGYVLYWQLTALGVKCEVVAPTLVPVKAGDRVKTDRRDAVKLARCYRAGDLTAVWVPDAAHEALRDLVRAREAAKKDQLRARHRLGKFLLRHGRRPPTKMTAWTQAHLAWVKARCTSSTPAQEATLLDYLHEVEHVADRIVRLERAIDDGGADGAAADARGDRRAAGAARDRAGLGGDDRRRSRRALALRQAPQLMGYSGLWRTRGFQRRADAARRHHENGQRAPPARRRRSGVGVSAPTGRGRRAAQTASGRSVTEVKEIAWKAQHRLHARYRALTGPRQMPAAGRDRDRARALGIHLGHRRRTSKRTSAPHAIARVATKDGTSDAATVAVEGHTERRILEPSMRQASGLEPALLVRGSSRRITIMRFRPANIRVINRRDSRLDRLRCCVTNVVEHKLT